LSLGTAPARDGRLEKRDGQEEKSMAMIFVLSCTVNDKSLP
jgi:hypothetical protein